MIQETAADAVVAAMAGFADVVAALVDVAVLSVAVLVADVDREAVSAGAAAVQIAAARMAACGGAEDRTKEVDM